MGTVDNLKRRLIAAASVVLLGTLVFVGSALADHPGPPSGDGITPVVKAGNPSCSELDPGTIELKVEPVADGTYSNGTLTVTIDVRDTADGQVLDWTSNIGLDSVFVKGGSNGNFYQYEPPAEDFGDTGLHSPVNHSNNQFFGLSHVSFCYDVAPPPQTGSLTVIKHVVNDDGGSATAANWTMNVSGPTTLSFPGAESPGTTNTVNAGSYAVTESGPAGYALSYSGDCDANGNVTVAAGESKSCTLTNNDQAAPPQPATLIVKKVVVNDDGGTLQAQDFSFSVNGGAPVAFEADGQNDLVVNAGTYDVTEPAVPGYTTTYQNCANIQLPAGGTATCTITNNDTAGPPQPATLIVKKVVVNDNGGTLQAQNFSFSVNGGAAQAFEADGQNDLSVPAGTYTVNEPAVAGYSTTYSNCSNLVIPAGGSATCTITNNDLAPGTTAVGSISVSKSADPTSLQEPGGQVAYSVRITNTSNVNLTVTSVSDDKFGDLDDEGGNGCFDVPINLGPGQFATCQFTRQITGAGGTSHVNTVAAVGHDENGHPVSGSDDARVDITQRLIDLVVVKDATSPTQLNGIVTYTMTVTNKGPDTATNVQLADPAPAGITYVTANPSQGTCSVSAALITCSLGTIASGQTVTITVTGRATQSGTHTNTATVTGSGGRETNPADNVDSAVTIVPAPLKPPSVTPKPKPKPEVCLAVTVTPKMIKADGKMDVLAVKVTAAGKRVKGAKVLVKAKGIRKTARTNGKGIATVRINARTAGFVTITTLERQKLCGAAKRIGVVGVFLPPLTG